MWAERLRPAGAGDQESTPQPAIHGKEHKMYKTIVVGYDGGAASRKAVDHAVALAQSVQGRIVIAWGVEFSKLPRATAAMGPMIDQAIAEANEAVKRVVDECKESCSLVEAVVIPEAPADALVTAAKNANADLIVVGTKGGRSLAAGVLGSTAYGLLHRSSLPVLVVPVK
jgi:nucleotide-binding universal stress UspA family protein